jgi:hypothetical protein
MTPDKAVPYNLLIQQRFPFAPLGLIVARRYGPDVSPQTVAELFDVSTRTLSRWKQNGLMFQSADRAAVAVGLHPSLVWPEWWVVPWADLDLDYPSDDSSWCMVAPD